MKTCTKCNVEQPLDNFYPKRGSRLKEGYRRSTCKSCCNKETISWQKNNPDKLKEIKRRTKLLSKYNLTLDEYNQMYFDQKGLCKLCLNPHFRRPLNVDHCHATGKIRGLLCDKCNLALGLINDDIDLLDRMKEYLS